jgi:hypothetical protein
VIVKINAINANGGWAFFLFDASVALDRTSAREALARHGWRRHGS